jgi:DUF1009 family protein
MSAALQTVVAAPKLCIIAGKGELPRTLINACENNGRPYFVLAVENSAEEETVALTGDNYAWCRLGAIGKALEIMRKEGVEEIVMAGHVTRPKLSGLRPDLKGTKLLARLGSQILGGDNEILSSIVEFLEEEGFRVCGVEEIVRDLVAPEGLIGSIYPDKRAQSDIAFAAGIARHIGELDIGQAVIVQNGHILGVEAIEGTDALIQRCAELKIEEKGGVLVKVKKPQQERRVDLPTIGLDTVQRVAECGFAGIAVEAGASLIVNRREVAREADRLGIFVVGFSILE